MIFSVFSFFNRVKHMAHRKFDPNKEFEVDSKTLAVFTKKGYKIQSILGAGSFGEVYKAIKIATDLLCAVKVIDMNRATTKYKNKFLPRELAALMEIRHENIIRVYDIFRASNKIYIFMEFASNGDISRYMKKNKGPLTEGKSRIWFEQVMNALIFLHEDMYTAHRDIKIDNILLSDNYIAKLTDFGFATSPVDADGSVVLSNTYCGTLPYYTPQVLQRKPYNAFAADVWAHGVVLYAMTHCKFPFHFKDPKSMLKEQLDRNYIIGRIKKEASYQLQDLLLKMLEASEEKRIKIKDIKTQPWIQNPSKDVE